jgi:hypothetical protein
MVVIGCVRMCTDVVVDVEGHGWKWMDDRIGYGIGLDVELDWIGLDVELEVELE